MSGRFGPDSCDYALVSLLHGLIVRECGASVGRVSAEGLRSMKKAMELKNAKSAEAIVRTTLSSGQEKRCAIVDKVIAGHAVLIVD